MRRIWILLFLLAAPLLRAQYRDDVSLESLYDSDGVSALKTDVAYICSPAHRGRKAGSPGEKDVAEYVWRELEKAGLEMLTSVEGDVFGIQGEKDTLISRNVIGVLPGADDVLRNRYIVIGAHIDHLGAYQMMRDGVAEEVVYPGANANASGVASLLALARHISATGTAFKKSILFIAFGSGCDSFAGAWYFLNRSFSYTKDIDFMINLDVLGYGSQGFYAYTASNADLNRAIEATSRDLQPVKPTLTSQEPYPSDHRAFYAKEIPSVLFTTGQYASHNSPRDTPDELDWNYMELQLEYIYNFVRDQASNPAPIDFIEPVVDAKQEDEIVYGYYDCDLPPIFLGSPRIDRFMQEWVYRYVKYPESAIREGVQGTVQVNFIIEKDGSVSNVHVVRSLDERLDEAAVNVVQISPKWKPARMHGKKVRSTLTIPIEFILKRK